MNVAPPPRANLLLVDDTPNNLRLLSTMLAEQGYEVRKVMNGAMALKTAAANPPDLILLDIKMPDMNGYEVCQHLKAIEQTQDIPVIFISALDEVLDKVKAFAVGGVDYITKPFSEEEVFARVENILTIRKLQQQLQQQNDRLKQEILDRQTLEARLLQSEAKYRTLFNNAIVGIFRIRPTDGLLLETNQRLAELLGYADVSQLVGQTIAQQHWLGSGQTQLLSDLQTHGDVPPCRSQFYRQDGSAFWGLFSAKMNQAENCIEGVIIEIE